MRLAAIARQIPDSGTGRCTGGISRRVERTSGHNSRHYAFLVGRDGCDRCIWLAHASDPVVPCDNRAAVPHFQDREDGKQYQRGAILWIMGFCPPVSGLGKGRRTYLLWQPRCPGSVDAESTAVDRLRNAYRSML